MPLPNERAIKIKPTVIQPQKTVSYGKPNPPAQRSTYAEMYGTIDKIWPDSIIYIIGGGPSLKDFNWDQLKDKNVIAINRAFETVPGAGVLYWTDTRFYSWYKEGITNFKGLKITCHPIAERPGDVLVLKPNESSQLDTRPSFINHGNSSGFGGINLAVKLGAKKIYLLGFDMGTAPNNTHWRSGYSIPHNDTIYDKMIEKMSIIPDQLRKMKIQIFNASPSSRLDFFRKCKIEEAINDTVNYDF